MNVRCPMCGVEAATLTRSLGGVWQGRCAACGAQCLPLAEAQQADTVERLRKPQSADAFSLPCPTCDGDRLRHAVTSRPVARRPLGCIGCGVVWRIPPESAARAVVETETIFSRVEADEMPAWAEGVENSPPAQLAIFFVAGALMLALVTGGVIGFLANATVDMWAHEMGHALALLACGWLAIPLPFFTQPIFDGGWVLALITTSALGAAAWWCWRTRHTYLCVLALAFAGLTVRYGVFGDIGHHDVLIAAAGVGGELVLGTLAIAAYFHRVVKRTSWDWMRYVFLIVGLAVFLPTWLDWAAIASDPSTLPRGSFFGGRDSGNGDMDRLLRELWTPGEIANGYVMLAEACAWVIAAHVGALAWRAWRWTTARRRPNALRRFIRKPD